MNRVNRTLAAFCIAMCSVVFAQNEPFALGADISWIQERENSGVKYYHEGQQQDIFAILKDHGFNYIRLRLFVDPTAKIPNESESPYSARGYCGLDSTLKMAKRVKAAGMKFLLDFHYSDTWADPAKQYKPMSWQDLNFTQLTEKVRSYTKETLEKFKANNVLPDAVQVGNEIVGGMIWPDGRNSNMSNFAKLMNAGIDGVKDVDANIKIMVHTINERNPNGWLTSLRNAGVTRIDVFALSYYTKWHERAGQAPDSLRRVATAFANSNSNNNIKIAVAEYSGFHREVNDVIFNLPNNKGFGTFVWEPADWNDNGEGKVLFDWNNGRRSNATLELYPQMAIDYRIINSSSSVASSSSQSSSSSLASSSSSSVPSSSSSALSSSSQSSSSEASSSSETSSSSSEGVTPILNSQLSTLNSQLPQPTYYNLRGTSLGLQKPTEPGVYIEKRGKTTRRILVW